MGTFLFAAFLIVTSTLSLLAEAQTIAAPEALDCAHKYWLRRLDSNVIGAEANTKLAQADWLPSLVVNAAVQKEVLIDPKVTQTSGNFLLSEKIFDLSRSFTIDQRRAEEGASRIDLEDQVFSILKTTITSYFSSVSGILQQQVYKKRVDRLKDFFDVVQELSKLKLVDRTSAYNLSAELTQAQSDILQIQLAYENTLSQFLGYLGVSDKRVSQLELHYVLPKAITVDAKKSAEQLPIVQNLHSQNDSLILGARSAKISFIPTISLNATYTPSTLNYSTVASVSPDGLSTLGGNNPSGLAVSGLLTWNLFDQGIRSIHAGQLSAQAERAETLAQARARQNELQIASLVKQYDLTLKSLEFTNERYKQASQAYESALTLFQIGKISFLLVKDSESALFGAELQLRQLEVQAATIQSQLSLYADYDRGHYKRFTERETFCRL